MSATPSKPRKSPGKRRSRTPEQAALASEEPGAAPVISFEKALAQLEEAVNQLETGEMPLEEALALFESGVKLSRQCNETLEAAERRIEILVADRNGGVHLEAFESGDVFETESDPDDETDLDEDFED